MSKLSTQEKGCLAKIDPFVHLLEPAQLAPTLIQWGKQKMTPSSHSDRVRLDPRFLVSIREDALEHALFPDQALVVDEHELDSFLTGKGPLRRGLAPLPNRSEVEFWLRAEEQQVIEPLAAFWVEIGQPSIDKLVNAWNIAIDCLASIFRLTGKMPFAPAGT